MLTASALLILITLCYLAARLANPLRSCRRCHGTGKRRTPTGRTSGRCPACKGTGWQIRTSRRLWTWWTRTRTAGTRPDPTDTP